MDEQILFQKYQVERKIASGGMGTIYLATDTKLGRQVAIKVLHPQYSGEAAFAQRFLREARAMAKLDHPNIIRIWSVEEEKASHSIVMEYFPGNDLKYLINEQGPLPIKDALSLITQIIQGLDYAHSMGIIHRDIKPANILVNQEGKVKITDFGIAAAFNESSLTIDGSVIGTPEYMAPEQARAEPVSSSTDLYSAGILLYELLTGQTPYKGIPAQTLISLLAFDPSSTSLTFPLDIPTELRVLILKLTKKEMESRLNDPEEILRLIKSIQQEQDPLQSDSAETALLTSEKSSNISNPTAASKVQLQSDFLETSPQIPSSHASSHSKSTQNRNRMLGAIGIISFGAIILLTLSQWNTPDISTSKKVVQPEILAPSKEEAPVKPPKNIKETPKPEESLAKPNAEFNELSIRVTSLDKEIDKLLNTFDTSTQEFNIKLSTFQSAIKQILNVNSSGLSMNDKLKALKSRIKKVEKEIQGFFNQSTNQKQELQNTLDATAKIFHQFEQENLPSAQKEQFPTLDKILQKNQTLLKGFPSASGEQLQGKLETLQSDVAKIEQELERVSQEKSVKGEEVNDVVQQASQLKQDLQEFHSKTLMLFQDLAQQEDTYATQIASPNFLSQKEHAADLVTKFHRSLGDLKASSLQESETHAQRTALFSQRQKEIREWEKNFTQSPFASTFQIQLSSIRSTLQAVKQNIQDLQEVAWKGLIKKIDRTLVSLNHTYETVKQARLQKEQSLQVKMDNFISAYVNRDFAQLQLLTSMSESRSRNLDLMFKVYSDIKIHIEILSIEDTQATAKMLIDKLTTKEGKTITPNAIIRETALTIPRKDGEWGKIQW